MTISVAFYTIITVKNHEVALTNLETKLNILTREFLALKSENEQLRVQIKFLKEESEGHKNRLSENYLLNQKQKKAIIRLEKILKKIDGCGSLNGK